MEEPENIVRRVPHVGRHYVSCIKIHGVPILPPVMNEARREEMRRYRQMAIAVERRPARVRQARQSVNRNNSVDSGVALLSASSQTDPYGLRQSPNPLPDSQNVSDAGTSLRGRSIQRDIEDEYYSAKSDDETPSKSIWKTPTSQFATPYGAASCALSFARYNSVPSSIEQRLTYSDKTPNTTLNENLLGPSGLCLVRSPDKSPNLTQAAKTLPTQQNESPSLENPPSETKPLNDDHTASTPKSLEKSPPSITNTWSTDLHQYLVGTIASSNSSATLETETVDLASVSSEHNDKENLPPDVDNMPEVPSTNDATNMSFVLSSQYLLKPPNVSLKSTVSDWLLGTPATTRHNDQWSSSDVHAPAINAAVKYVDPCTGYNDAEPGEISSEDQATIVNSSSEADIPNVKIQSQINSGECSETTECVVQGSENLEGKISVRLQEEQVSDVTSAIEMVSPSVLLGTNHLEPISQLERQRSFTVQTGPSDLVTSFLEDQAQIQSSNCDRGTPVDLPRSRRGWDLASARALWSSSEQLFAIPKQPVRHSPQKRGVVKSLGGSASRKNSLPGSASASPSKRAFSFGSVDSLVSKPARQSLNFASPSPKRSRRSNLDELNRKTESRKPSNAAEAVVRKNLSNSFALASNTVIRCSLPVMKMESLSMQSPEKIMTPSKACTIQQSTIAPVDAVIELPPSRNVATPEKNIADLLLHLKEEHNKQMSFLLAKQRAEQLKVQEAFALQQQKLMEEITKSFPEAFKSSGLPVNILSVGQSGTQTDDATLIVPVVVTSPVISTNTPVTENITFLQEGVNIKNTPEPEHLLKENVDHQNSSSVKKSRRKEIANFPSDENIFESDSNKENVLRSYCSDTIAFDHNLPHLIISTSDLDVSKCRDSPPKEKLLGDGDSMSIGKARRNVDNSQLTCRSWMDQSDTEIKIGYESFFPDGVSTTRQMVPRSRSVQVATEEEKVAASKIVTVARGFLVRRLMRTELVQDMIMRIKETYQTSLELDAEIKSTFCPSVADVNLSKSLTNQLNAEHHVLHDLFVTSTVSHRMATIAADRDRLRRKSLSRPSSSRRSLSAATQSYLKRKKESKESPERRPATTRRLPRRPVWECVSTCSQRSCRSIRRDSMPSWVRAHPMQPKHSSQTLRKPWR